MRKDGPILILGPMSRPYSYARIIRSLVSRLARRYDFHQFALDLTTPILSTEDVTYHNAVAGDVYGIERLSAVIERVRPKVLWIVNDMWLYFAHMHSLQRYSGKLNVVLYSPVDGTNLNPAHVRALAGISRLVLFTQFARRVVETAVMRTGLPPSDLPEITLIPHGVETEVFRPCVQETGQGSFSGRRSPARREIFPGRDDLEDAFIVLNANQNNRRKRIDVTIEGFARFAAGKPANVRLYLHTDTTVRGCELLPVADACGIQDRLLLTNSAVETPEVADERLNLIYNCCDVGLNTSIGEGWGMVAFEHGATGAAQVMPCHSACEELWAASGVLVEAPELVHYRHDAVDYHCTKPELVAAALESLHANPEELLQRSRFAYENATDPKYNWDRIATRWDLLFQELMAGAS